jgi:hypothetical protein
MNLFLISSSIGQKMDALKFTLLISSQTLMVLVSSIVHQDLVRTITKCVFNIKSSPLTILLFHLTKMVSLPNRYRSMKENMLKMQTKSL